MKLSEIRRGQIWLVNWNPGRGSEQWGKRPALIIQTDAANLNPRYPNTIVLAVSTKGLPVATHVEIEPGKGTGLRETSFVKGEQILTISKERLEEYIGQIPPDILRQVETAVRLALAL
ncbi:MAG: type II toxin-antitoxin system PemK/MazF family toxin [Verrucomicrobia bacterium]|nr:type II toxin-antitoxin system PemK/MazF family toxin [Verrucomicrobiota bacterium]